MPACATAWNTDVSVSTQLWPIAWAGSLPVCFNVSFTSVQSAATARAGLVNCMASVPSMVSSQVLAACVSGANALSAPSTRVEARILESVIGLPAELHKPCDSRLAALRFQAHDLRVPKGKPWNKRGGETSLLDGISIHLDPSRFLTRP